MNLSLSKVSAAILAVMSAESGGTLEFMARITWMALSGSPESARSWEESMWMLETFPAIAPAYLTWDPRLIPVTSWKLTRKAREGFPSVVPLNANANARKSRMLQAMTAKATAQSLKFLFFMSRHAGRIAPGPLLYAPVACASRRKPARELVRAGGDTIW